MTSREGPARWVLFCEGSSDARVVRDLVDRVLCEEGGNFIRHAFAGDQSGTLRAWVTHRDDLTFLDLHGALELARELRITPLRGRFDQPAGEHAVHGAMHGARAVLRMLQIASKISCVRRVDGVVIVADADQARDERRSGQEVGLALARALVTPLPEPVIALCVPEIEAWVIAAFEPSTDTERRRLSAAQSRVGADPRCTPERLTSKRESDPRDAKGILDLLSDFDAERAARGLDETPLETLRVRGADSGLRAFLDAAAAVLLPHVDPSARARD